MGNPRYASGNGRTGYPPWRRRATRAWVIRAGRGCPEELLLGAIPSLPRASLVKLTERMIDRMDDLEGDPDLEDGHDGEQVNEDGGVDIHSALPLYGSDQSEGPVNYRREEHERETRLRGRNPDPWAWMRS